MAANDDTKVTIYALIDPFTGGVRYVGKTIDLKMRMRGHLSVRNLSSGTHAAYWIMSILERGFFPLVKVLEVVDANRWEDAERNWIGFYRSSGNELCNLTDGGEGPHGCLPSDETKKKMSERQRERWEDPELRKKFGEASRKRWEDPVFKEKVVGPQRGRKRPPEHQQKMNESLRKVYSDPAMKQALSERTKKLWEDPAYRAKIVGKNCGKKRTDEQRAAMGDAHRGKKHTAETREKMRESALKRFADPEARANMSESIRKALENPEVRAKMSRAKLGNCYASKSKEPRMIEKKRSKYVCIHNREIRGVSVKHDQREKEDAERNPWAAHPRACTPAQPDERRTDNTGDDLGRY